MLDAIKDVLEIVEGKTVSNVENDRHTRLLIERNIEILSEASRHLPTDLKDRNPEIPWKNVAGVGNVMRHDYDGISYDILLAIARNNLPRLERVCLAELQHGRDLV